MRVFDPASCEVLPVPRIDEADRIYRHIEKGEPVVLTRMGETDSPFILEVTAGLAPRQKQSTYGFRPIESPPERLRIESWFQFPLRTGEAEFGRIQGSYLSRLHDNKALRHLIDTTYANNKRTALRLQPIGEPGYSATVYSPKNLVDQYVVRMTNDRNASISNLSSRAPEFNRENFSKIIATYLGLAWIVGHALGDSRLPEASLLDRYASGSEFFHRKPGGGRPRAKTAVKSEPTIQELRTRNKQIADLKRDFPVESGTQPQPLDEYVLILGKDASTEAMIRVQALREQERARMWGIQNLGGLAIAGEPDSGKSTLAHSITASADVTAVVRATDVQDDTISGFQDRVETITRNSATVGVVFEQIDLFEHLSPVQRQRVALLAQYIVGNPRTLLVGTLQVEDPSRTSSQSVLKRLGLFGNNQFSHIINLKMTEPAMRKAVEKLLHDDVVHGQQIFETLTAEKFDTFMQGVYGPDGATIGQIKSAIQSCVAEAFFTTRDPKAGLANPISVHTILSKLYNDGHISYLPSETSS
jgi:hypothetical protein